MAIIVKTAQGMVNLINLAITAARGDAEMIIVPMLIADTVKKAKNLLLDVGAFMPGLDGDVLPNGAIGWMRIGKQKTAYDALEEISSSPLPALHDVLAAMSNAVEKHVPGKTYRVRIHSAGELIVDVEQFAKMSQLPLESEGHLEYSVFLHEVENRPHGGTRTMLVLVRGLDDIADGNGGNPASLQPMVARLEVRSKSGFEQSASFHARDLENSWQLYNNEQFADLLAWLRSGYYYTVVRDENRGLCITY